MNSPPMALVFTPYVTKCFNEYDHCAPITPVSRRYNQRQFGFSLNKSPNRRIPFNTITVTPLFVYRIENIYFHIYILKFTYTNTSCKQRKKKRSKDVCCFQSKINAAEE